MAAPENLLDELEGLHRPDEESVGLLLLVVDAINREFTDEMAAGDRDRLRKVVDRLRRVARDVADASGASGFSITGGLPAGISVTVEWQLGDSSAGMRPSPRTGLR